MGHFYKVLKMSLLHKKSESLAVHNCGLFSNMPLLWEICISLFGGGLGNGGNKENKNSA
jgi:hypothetical protein